MKRDPMMDKDAAMQPSRPPQGLGMGMAEPPPSAGAPPEAGPGAEGPGMGGPGMEPGMAADQEMEQASPEEQAQYEQVMNNAYELIFDEKTMPGVLESLAGDGDPKLGLATTAASIVTHLKQSAEQGGQPLSEDVVYHAGVAILEDLADLAGKAGIHEFTEEEAEGALYQAMDVYRELNAGEIDQERYAGELEGLKQADKAGTLGQMLPGIEKVAERGGNGGGGQPA